MARYIDTGVRQGSHQSSALRLCRPPPFLLRFKGGRYIPLPAPCSLRLRQETFGMQKPNPRSQHHEHRHHHQHPQQRQATPKTAKEVISAPTCRASSISLGRTFGCTYLLSQRNESVSQLQLGNILESARWRAVTHCYTSPESINAGFCASVDTRDGQLVAV